MARVKKLPPSSLFSQLIVLKNPENNVIWRNSFFLILFIILKVSLIGYTLLFHWKKVCSKILTQKVPALFFFTTLTAMYIFPYLEILSGSWLFGLVFDGSRLKIDTHWILS